MEISLYNIQGFRGYFIYTIDDLITIINSKQNGVGKTTLFDCLRFLVDKEQVDKEEHQFFLNLEEEEGMFSVKKDGVTHGFALKKGNPPVFFKQVEGEEVESSSDNFPNVGQDIGILHINDSLLNIFSKEVNLFSSSNSAQNYQLVKEITTHQPTQEMMSLIEQSIAFNSQEMTNLRNLYNQAKIRVESTPYYYQLDLAEELMNNPFYQSFESHLNEIYLTLSNLKEVPELNFNSDIEELLAVQESLNRLQPSDFNPPNAETLEQVQAVIDSLDRVQVINELNLNVNPLEQLVLVSESLEKLVPSTEEIPLNIEVLEQLDLVVAQMNKVHVVPSIDVSSTLPMQLSQICIKLGEMTTASNQEARFLKLATDSRANIAGARVQCPIREEVYLINGKCVY